ncbi:Vitamin B12-binding protein [Austwickia sp. TVS 96-490-7B]|uniref:helical backbone metal receptor n=1 Tax=Austwickia sp. TVS 96-490-7B TaxID=2830843 RepID=UPI001D636757|nr:helical backbone metal receptor [Austwickia sp. TVS 96-490-7B]MBW3085695.1 Vitamin B12-binding protein [Austwickia sp. TVS 96-490-7B]
MNHPSTDSAAGDSSSSPAAATALSFLRDDVGVLVPVDTPPRRVISLVPSLTEAVALSAPHTLIGATRWCTHPADLDLLRVGGTKDPDLSAIIAARPDLVIANEEENRACDVAALREHHVPVWVTAIDDVPSALRSLSRLLTVLGVSPSGPRGWYDDVRTAWQQPPQITGHGRALRVVVPIWRRPWMVVGAGTYATDVLTRLGMVNVAAARGSRYPRIDPAQICQSTPVDLVLLPDEPYPFSAVDGPESVETPAVSVPGRALFWYGPAMVTAPSILRTAICTALGENKGG